MCVKNQILLLVSLLTTSFVVGQTTVPMPNTGASTKQSKKAEKKQQITAIQRLEEEENDLIFNKHSIFGFKFNTDGWGLSYEKGKFKSRRKATLLQFEFNEKKHPKEYKLSNGSAFFSSNEWVTGKINNFYQIKGAYGLQYLLGTKGNKNGVHVSAIGAGGLSAGILRSYVVDVVDINNQTQFEATYPDIIEKGYVELGSAGIFRGWNNASFAPGAHFKTALRFDYGKFNESIGAIEAGVNLEYYFTDVPQMAYNKERNMFFNAYVSILFGRRK